MSTANSTTSKVDSDSDSDADEDYLVINGNRIWIAEMSEEVKRSVQELCKFVIDNNLFFTMR